METNWGLQTSPLVGFPLVLVNAILGENSAADVACALDEGARDYFLIWKFSGKEN